MRLHSVIISFFLVSSLSVFASENQLNLEKQDSSIVEKGKKNKNGRYKKRKHLLKKLWMGKRYCDCPKH